MRLLLGLFACIQLSPLGLSWCHTADGAIHQGCSCGDCRTAPSPPEGCQDACCARRVIELAQQANNAAQTPGQALAQPQRDGCCTHAAMQYSPQSRVLRSPERTASMLHAVAPQAAVLPASPRLASMSAVQAKAPPWPPAATAVPICNLPLRI